MAHLFLLVKYIHFIHSIKKARQMGHCMGVNFNIHIWAWSASPSVQVGGLQENRTQSAWTVVTYLPLEISYLYFVRSSELDKLIFHS